MTTSHLLSHNTLPYDSCSFNLFLFPPLTVPSLMTHSLSLSLAFPLNSLISTRFPPHNSLAIPHNWSSMENMNIAFSIHSNCADLPEHQPRKGDAIKWPIFCRDPFCARL